MFAQQTMSGSITFSKLIGHNAAIVRFPSAMLLLIVHCLANN